MVKSYFLLSMLCFLCVSQMARSQNFPFMVFTKDSVHSVPYENQKKDLTCRIMLTKSWAYPNGQASYPCDAAINACITQGLIQQKMKETKNAHTLQVLVRTLAQAKEEAALQIMGCQLAIESTLLSNKTVIEAAGYPSASGGGSGK